MGWLGPGEHCEDQNQSKYEPFAHNNARPLHNPSALRGIDIVVSSNAVPADVARAQGRAIPQATGPLGSSGRTSAL